VAVPCAISATVHSCIGSTLAGGWRLFGKKTEEKTAAAWSSAESDWIWRLDGERRGRGWAIAIETRLYVRNKK
jgi:hypothetical protein